MILVPLAGAYSRFDLSPIESGDSLLPWAVIVDGTRRVTRCAAFCHFCSEAADLILIRATPWRPTSAV